MFRESLFLSIRRQLRYPVADFAHRRVRGLNDCQAQN
jgi:hypothetical protein